MFREQEGYFIEKEGLLGKGGELSIPSSTSLLVFLLSWPYLEGPGKRYGMRCKGVMSDSSQL